MIAKLRFYLDSKGNYAEKRIRFPRRSIVHTAEVIEAFCKGYTVGTNRRAFVMSIADVGEFDFDFDDRKECHAAAGYFSNLVTGSVNREADWKD